MKELPRGIRIDHGYVQVRIMHQGRSYFKNFGPDSILGRQLAEIHLSEKRKEILMGRFGVSPELPTRKFAEAAHLYIEKWALERDPDGNLVHRGVDEARRILKHLAAYFGNKAFHNIRPVDVQRWREHRLKFVVGTSVNREQAVLSSVFSHIARWVANEQIPAFKLPVFKMQGEKGEEIVSTNPCTSVEKAPSRKRKRVLTVYEAKKLKFAFIALGDEDGWEICKLALKSVLSLNDMRALELGQEIDIERAKTGVAVNIPLPYLVKLNWTNWRKRWVAALEMAGLAAFDVKRTTGGRTYKVLNVAKSPNHVQFRDLRKTGINWLKGRHDLKLISEYAGHADIKTTEGSYTINQAAYLEPLARDISAQVDAI